MSGCGECYYWRTKGSWAILEACFNNCSCPAPPDGPAPDNYIEILFCHLEPSDPTPPGRSGFVITFDPDAIAVAACVISRTGKQTWFYAASIPVSQRVPLITVDEQHIRRHQERFGQNVEVEASMDSVLVFGSTGNVSNELIGVGQVASAPTQNPNN